jgi:hypothetical protein
MFAEAHSERDFINHLILFDNAPLADRLCELNGWVCMAVVSWFIVRRSYIDACTTCRGLARYRDVY